MDYLLLQILLFLILAAVIGFFIGWVTRGFGFESRLLAAENQWRSKHHALQNENSRLQTEVDESLSLESTNNTYALGNDASFSYEDDNDLLKQETPPSTEEIDTSSKNHPLDRLRNELNQIEEAHTKKLEKAQQQTELFTETEENIIPENLFPLSGDDEDLTRIKGIGPNVASTLNQLGITQIHQIADLTEGNIKWLNEQLEFNGRIERESWVDQAQKIEDDKN